MGLRSCAKTSKLIIISFKPISGPRAHYQAAACLKPGHGKDGQVRTCEASLMWEKGACARSRSSIGMNGTSHTCAMRSCEWSFACKHKRPPLKCPLLAWVEFCTWAQAPSACMQSSVCASGGRTHPSLAQKELCTHVCACHSHTHTLAPDRAAKLERLGTADLDDIIFK